MVIGGSFNGYEPIYEINRSCIWKFTVAWLAMKEGWTVNSVIHGLTWTSSGLQPYIGTS